MPGSASLPTRSGEGLTPGVLSEYRLWVCRNLDKLLVGDRQFWEEFRDRRERLLALARVRPGVPFAWEASFVQAPLRDRTLSRRALCAIGGVSPSSLRSYLRLGLLEGGNPVPVRFQPHHVKRLQWILFFLRELGIAVPGLAALLSLQSVRDHVDRLARSQASHYPVHLSPPQEQAAAEPVEGVRTPAGSANTREFLHDLGNRLHIIGGRANLLKNKLAGNAVAERNLSIILSQVEMAANALKTHREAVLGS
jgi:DNA-binding transcriptional MerR regulator